MRINKKENDAVVNASLTSECIWKGPAQDQSEKIIKPEVSAQHILTLCYLPPLGILQAVLKSVAVVVVYWISLAVPRVSHADCWRHFLNLSRWNDAEACSNSDSWLFNFYSVQSQTWDFQHFQG